VRAEGTDAFKARINQHAQPLADYFFQQLTEEADPRSLEGKAHMATLAAPLIDKVPGANLRTLMRQRLTEITGLTDRSANWRKARPHTRPARLRPRHRLRRNARLQRLPATGRVHPAAGMDPEKPGAGGKNGKTNPGTRTGVAEREQRPGAGRRRTAHADGPAHAAAPPATGRKVEDAGHFAAEEQTNNQLLVALIEAVQKNPKLSSIQLMRAGTAPNRVACCNPGGKGMAD
jgi:DNA primase